MINPASILIWDGRLHLGDEPGIHGSAAYIGLTAEFPLTAKPYTSASSAPLTVTVVLEAEDVNVYPGYPGHLITVTGYLPLNPADPLSHWQEVPIALPAGEDRLQDKETSHELHIQNVPVGLKFFSVRVRVDTQAAPGLYDDFLITRLSYDSASHYLLFGFRD